MLTVRAFYAQARWGDQWNVLRPNGTRHRGHDISCDSREDIPLLRRGTVVKNGHTSVLGNFCVVQVDEDEFDFYCHLLIGTRPDVSLVALDPGVRVGKAAGWGDDHGSAWTGPHLHYGSGPKITSVTTGTTYNATAIVVSVLSSTAGGGTTPLPDPPPVPPVEEREIPVIHAAWLGPDGTVFVQCRPGGKLTGLGSEIDWKGIQAGSGAKAAPATAAEIKQLQTRYGTLPYPQFDAEIPMRLDLGETTIEVKPDNTELIAAVNALGEKIDALPAEIDRYADGEKQS